MRVVTWNCRRASAQSPLWDYLLELAPDVALLQEVCGIPKRVESHYASCLQTPVRKNGMPQSFTTAILVHGSMGDRIMLKGPAEWVDSELQRFAGNIVGVELQPELWPRVKVICVYSPAWPVDKSRLVDVDVAAVRLTQNRNVWVGDFLWGALSVNKPQPNDHWIIGGDFNLCETFDSWHGGPTGNREYLDRMAKLGLVDCLRHARKALTPTFCTLGSGTVTAQIDYLFVTDVLRSRLLACNIGSRERVFANKLSDHLPIIADFGIVDTCAG